MVYESDTSAIKDAENELLDQTHNLKISELESQIESLEKAMESEIETVDKEITKYEEYKKQIQDVTDAYENAENVKYALAVTGLNSESEILQCRTDVLNTFKDNYIRIQQSIVDAAWESANEQNKAMASVGTGSTNGGGNIGTTVNYAPTPEGIKVVEDKKIPTPLEKLKNDSKFKKDSNFISNPYKWGYSTGTDNAKPGIHEVSENGDEIIIDNNNNAILAKGHQLYNFTGGERVIERDKSKELLGNHGNLIPLELGNMSENFRKIYEYSQTHPIMPNYMPNYSMSRQNITPVNNTTNVQPSVTIGDIHLHEVQNVDSFSKAIVQKFPNKMLQELHKR